MRWLRRLPNSARDALSICGVFFLLTILAMLVVNVAVDVTVYREARLAQTAASDEVSVLPRWWFNKAGARSFADFPPFRGAARFGLDQVRGKRLPIRIIFGPCLLSAHKTSTALVVARVIVLCSGEKARFIGLMRQGTPEQKERLADLALTFIALHELGHVVIGQMHLPVLGREEDAADEFATLVSINSGFPEIASAGASMFAVQGPRPMMYDEHSDNLRRAGWIRCFLNAYDPVRYSAMAKVPEWSTWTVTCDKQYRDHVVAWNRVLHNNAFRLPRQSKQ